MPQANSESSSESDACSVDENEVPESQYQSLLTAFSNGRQGETKIVDDEDKSSGSATQPDLFNYGFCLPRLNHYRCSKFQPLLLSCFLSFFIFFPYKMWLLVYALCIHLFFPLLTLHDWVPARTVTFLLEFFVWCQTYFFRFSIIPLIQMILNKVHIINVVQLS